MSFGGTDMYATLDEASVPPLVLAAVAAARELDFPLCVHPATGGLLRVLAAGVPPGGRIGEAGTGTGAGLAWLVSGADSSVSLLSVESDVERADAATRVFADLDNVTVLKGDAGDVYNSGPFDLFIHDGGWGVGKNGGDLVDPAELLVEGGTMTVDDFTPTQEWPMMFNGESDEARNHWLTRPGMLATEVRVAANMSVVVARRTTGAAARSL